jgi:hypothetical protein
MTKDQPTKELIKIIDALSESITKLKIDEITIEEANAIAQEWGKSIAKIERELKKLKKRK